MKPQKPFSRAGHIGALGGVLVSAFAACAFAQGGNGQFNGVPQDWSHRHLIFSNPDTRDQAAAKGSLGEWAKKARDPRFVLHLEKKEQKQEEAAAVAAMEMAAGSAARGATATVVGAKVRAATSQKGRKAPPPTGPAIDRDWSNVMGGAFGVGDSRLFPAKFSFFTNTTNNCTADFVVFTTSTAGAASLGTVNSRPGTFTGVPVAGQTVTITNTRYIPGQVLTLTADASQNTGLMFAVGTSANEAATNLGNAIARNGGKVGVTATVAGAVVTVTSITTAVTNANLTSAETLANFAWGAQTAGAGTAGQPTIFAVHQLYDDTVANGGCQTSTQAVPAVFWSYNTGTGAVADLSPVLSFYDGGQQVAFVQRTAAVSSLVLLKWSSSSPGTLGVPTVPTSETAATYRACTAPCMLVMPLSGNPDVTNSAPFVDYSGDFLWVGDDTGRLHQFTGVFAGAPAEAGAPWPVTVSTGNVLSSPVYDGSGLIFVGSNCAANTTNCNRLHSVSTTGGLVVNSGAIGSASIKAPGGGNGVRDAPIVDGTAGRVYAFTGADNGATDSLGNTCGGTCAAVYQFVTSASLATQNSGLGAGLGAKVIVGPSGNNNDLNRAINSGAFDDAYYSSATPSSPSGSLYACGSLPATARRYTLWKISIASNSFSARTQGPQINDANGVDLCSPVTVFKNGSSEFLFVGVSVGMTVANELVGGGGCATPASGCVYMVRLPMPVHFETTSANSTFDGTTRFMNVSASVALNTSEPAVQTTLAAAEGGTYVGMIIVQGAATPAATTFTYTLRNNAGNTAITCDVTAGNTVCTDTTNTASVVAGDKIDVQVTRTSGTGTIGGKTVAVRLGGVAAALNAPGGTGGIIVDNTATGGGSQVYYSTRTSPGIAVQASQAGLN